MFKLKPLSLGQQLGWYWASFVYGVFVVFWTLYYDILAGPEEWFSVLVLVVSWVIPVLLLRVYVQDKDPTSFRSILGLDARDGRQRVAAKDK